MESSTTSSQLHPLVTQNLIQTNKFFCPFLERGFCRDASRCSFSHDSIKSIKIPTGHCHFYLANQCLYGQDCKFRHSEPNRQSLSIGAIIAAVVAPAPAPATTQTPTSSTPILATLEAISDLATVTPSVASPHATALATTALKPPATFNTALDCDLCGRPCLHPHDLDQQLQHREECLREHEREMELSFAIQRSKDKVCGICMDTVVEKTPITSSRFGILEKCNHIFCLDCIRKWRGTKQFETRTIRACPECRVSSDFVVPSKYWIEDENDKEKLIQDYKTALRSKPCKYFDEGKGDCPFAGSCFYKHAYPDGRLATEDLPKPRRRFYGNRGPTSTVANYILWNILASTDEDDWSNDELESLYYDPDLGSDEDDENTAEEWLYGYTTN